MKQNQNTNRGFVVPDLRIPQDHHFLKLKSHCLCSACQLIHHPQKPQIVYDEQLQRLRKNNKIQKQSQYLFFLQQLYKSKIGFPPFKFLDTLIMQKGQSLYCIWFQNKIKIQQRINAKQWIIHRKQQLDLQYQMKKYERQTGFTFSSFEHACEKKIKQFQNNIKYKIPESINKTAIIKFKGQQEMLFVKNQFKDMFDPNKPKIYNIQNIEYIQVFPIMHAEQHHSFFFMIKYCRTKQCDKKSYKLAQSYSATWSTKNQSLVKLQQKIYDQIQQIQGKKIDVEGKLTYQTYKLMLYFQQATNIRIDQALVHYLTNDDGNSFFLRKIDCLKYQKRNNFENIKKQLPNKAQKQYEQKISLPNQMNKIFDGFQQQFKRLQKQRQEMQQKIKKDKQFSNYVFHTVNKRQGANFHDILKKQSLKERKKVTQFMI